MQHVPLSRSNPVGSPASSLDFNDSTIGDLRSALVLLRDRAGSVRGGSKIENLMPTDIRKLQAINPVCVTDMVRDSQASLLNSREVTDFINASVLCTGRTSFGLLSGMLKIATKEERESELEKSAFKPAHRLHR